VFARAGARDLGGWLSHVIDCRAFVDKVSTIPIVGQTLVATHLDLRLSGYCTSALTKLGAAIEREVRGWSFELVDMASGRCDMNTHGNQIDELSRGEWTMMIHVGDEDQQVKAPFHGTRITADAGRPLQ
jgi:hypothetical protein